MKRLKVSKKLFLKLALIFCITVILSILASADSFDSLPADSAPASDVLMRESFTDGSMTEGIESITNPIWKTNAPSPNLEASDTNAYLNCSYESYYYVAGDRQWTDYSTSVDLTFTSSTATGDANRISLLVRHTDIAQYGYHDYVVTLKNGNTVSIGHRVWTSSMLTEETVFTSATLNYLANLDISNTLKVDTLDNVISVYWNGVFVLSYTDTGEFNGSVNDIKTKGCIGFYTSQAYVYVDNITVTDLEDDYGGDYDNEIGGNFNSVIPDYITTYSENGWLYK